jgi:hypothetical protein
MGSRRGKVTGQANTLGAEAMTNRELIRLFETDSLPHEFHHADHVRVAFAYLQEYPTLEAIEKFAGALKAFAASRGKPNLYHETITCAYCFLIRERMVRGTIETWDEFEEQNRDLLISRDAILTRYYSAATLQSDLARSAFVLPDKGLHNSG